MADVASFETVGRRVFDRIEELEVQFRQTPKSSFDDKVARGKLVTEHQILTALTRSKTVD